MAKYDWHFFFLRLINDQRSTLKTTEKFFFTINGVGYLWIIIIIIMVKKIYY